jgi:cytochrome c peroxidase
VSKIESGPSADAFQQAYGPNVLQETTDTIYGLMAQAIVAYENSAEVSPFSSKYDAYEAGLVQLSPMELEGLRIATGSLSGRPGGIPFRVNAHCVECHGIPSTKGDGPDLWTNSCYANLGAPRNPNNPYYKETNPKTDPVGYNPLGSAYIDFGLGDFLYPYNNLPVADLDQDDPLAIDGTFKTPTLRNVDKRPYPGFVKCYMHNGCFKSLQEVVHFYNTRNLTTYPGEIINFTLPNPYAGLQGYPLWPHPEWPSPISMVNPAGVSGSGSDGDGTNDEQIGNIGLSSYEEQCIVAFLQTLTDGYFQPSSTLSNTVKP